VTYVTILDMHVEKFDIHVEMREQP